MPNAALLTAYAGLANVSTQLALAGLVWATYYRRIDSFPLLSILPVTWLLQAAAILVETWCVGSCHCD